MSEVFKKLFGCPPEKIKPTCIILPSNDRELFRKTNPGKIIRGLFFNVQDCDKASLINLKDRSLAGDCLMHLRQTDCGRVFLFGACGGITLDCGEKILAGESFNLESFSSFLSLESLQKARPVPAPGKLGEQFLEFAAGKIKPACCATVSSLYLENKKRDLLAEAGIDCVDMESSMVFSSASYCSMEAASLLYCADVPGRINYYDEFPSPVREKIKGARRNLADLLVKFLKSE